MVKMWHQKNPNAVFIKTGYSSDKRGERLNYIKESAPEWTINEMNIIHFSVSDARVAKVVANVFERYFQEHFPPTKYLCGDVGVSFEEISKFSGMSELSFPPRYNETSDSLIEFWNTSYRSFVSKYLIEVNNYIESIFTDEFKRNWYNLHKGFHYENTISSTKFYNYIKNNIFKNYFPEK